MYIMLHVVILAPSLI